MSIQLHWIYIQVILNVTEIKVELVIFAYPVSG